LPHKKIWLLGAQCSCTEPSYILSKQAAQKFDVGRFNLRKLCLLKVRKQIKISNRSAALENLHDSKDINRAWENIKENIKTSAKDSLGLYELKQHKPWYNEVRS
jgi:predicted lipase